MRLGSLLVLGGLWLLAGPGGLRGQESDGAAAELRERWVRLAGEAEVWRRADITDPHERFVFDLVAHRVRAREGVITRQQFLTLSAGTAGGPGSPESSRRPRSGPGPGSEEEFRERDANGDGVLSHDEMDDLLRSQRPKWDRNRDGFIDRDEYQTSQEARKLQEQANARQTEPETGNRKPAGREGTPRPGTAAQPWLKQHDTDGDGQVGFYEWRAAHRPAAEFARMDLNGDGFLTPDEVTWVLGAGKASRPGAHDGGLSP